MQSSRHLSRVDSNRARSNWGTHLRGRDLPQVAAVLSLIFVACSPSENLAESDPSRAGTKVGPGPAATATEPTAAATTESTTSTSMEATTTTEPPKPELLVDIKMDDVPFGDAAVIKEWRVGSGVGELGIDLPDGNIGFGMPRSFDLTADGSFVVQDVVNGRWVVEPATGQPYEFVLPNVDIGDVWDSLIGPHDVLYAVTDNAIRAYRFAPGEVVELAMEPRTVDIIQGGRIRETVAGVSTIQEGMSPVHVVLGYVDRRGEPIGEVIPGPSSALGGAFVVDAIANIGFVDGDIDPRFEDVTPIAAEAAGSATNVLVFGWDAGGENVHTAILVFDDGQLIFAGRDPLWNRRLHFDGLGTDVRLYDGAIYTMNRTVDSPDDLSGGIQLVRVDPKLSPDTRGES